MSRGKDKYFFIKFESVKNLLANMCEIFACTTTKYKNRCHYRNRKEWDQVLGATVLRWVNIVMRKSKIRVGNLFNEFHSYNRRKWEQNRNEMELCARDEWLWNFTLISSRVSFDIYLLWEQREKHESMNFITKLIKVWQLKNFKYEMHLRVSN